jgi:hypothetical protein
MVEHSGYLDKTTANLFFSPIKLITKRILKTNNKHKCLSINNIYFLHSSRDCFALVIMRHRKIHLLLNIYNSMHLEIFINKMSWCYQDL